MSLLCDMAVTRCAVFQYQKNVRNNQIKQISDRKKISITNNVQQGGRDSAEEGMATLVVSKNKQPTSSDKSCGIFTALQSFGMGERGGSSAYLGNKKTRNNKIMDLKNVYSFPISK